MLVLTRKLMEKLFIGDDICVTVVRLEGGQVRLGIEAPREVTVVRAELVPERQLGPHRGGPRQAHLAEPRVASPAVAGSVPRPELRIPQAAVRETDNRRRGPSR
jgi:carbon storage regulator